MIVQEEMVSVGDFRDLVVFHELVPGCVWQLICPECLAPGDVVDVDELVGILSEGCSSVCFDCDGDPAIKEPIPYVLVENGGNSSPVASERVLEVDDE